MSRREQRKRRAAKMARLPLQTLTLEHLEDRLTPSTLIPVSGPRDLVFDPVRNQLDITTSTGKLERYDLNTQSLLTPFVVGTSLNGADITPDGQYMYIAEGQVSGSNSQLRKVNLSTGAVTTISYVNSSLESGAWDIAIDSSGTAYFDGKFAGSGWVPLRKLDTSNDTISASGHGNVQQNTQITRSGDRSLLFFEESNISSGPVFSFDAVSKVFSASQDTSAFHDSDRAAINANGSLLAMEFGSSVVVFDRNYKAVENFVNMDGGLAFHPTMPLLFMVNSTTNEVVAYDTATWRERYRLPVGEDIGASAALGSGVMTFSADGQKLFLIGNSGIRMLDVPQSSTTPATLQVSGYSSFVTSGANNTFTVSIKNSAGELLSNYNGTVQFSSTAPSASLPANYTFTLADGGTHTFTAPILSTGNFTVTIKDVATPTLTATTSSINSHSTPVALIPVTTARDLVFDPIRNTLLMTTGSGTIERFDVASQSLLPPLLLGTSALNSADITADGNTLYVMEDQPNLAQGVIRKVNLATGAGTLLSYNKAASERGGWDIAIASNGVALFDTQFGGSGWVALRQLNISNDTISATSHADVRQNTLITRSGDRSLLFFEEANISSGPVFSFDAVNQTYSTSRTTDASHSSDLAAINADGSLTAMEFGSSVVVFDRNYKAVENFINMDGGLAFHPTMPLLFMVNSTTNEVVAYDTVTWRERYRLPVGEDIGASTTLGSGAMTFSADGKKLFLIGGSGVRVFDVPQSSTTPATLQVSGYSSFVTSGANNTFTVSIKNSAGELLSNYNGTVQFSSTAPSASLPANYTFTPGDAGTHTFTAPILSTGNFTVTIKDVVTPTLTATTSSINSHNAPVSLIPVTSARDLVYDSTRNILLMTTSSGTIERFDIASQSLLAPFSLGTSSLNGADITSDGSSLYVMEDQANLVQGVIRKVNLATGVTTFLSYDKTSSERGGWDISIASNGVGFFDGQFSGSGWVPLRQLDAINGTLSVSSHSTVRQNTHITRGVDRSRLLLMESNASSGPLHTYSGASGTFSAEFDTNLFLSNTLSAMNRDGSLFIVGNTVRNAAFTTVQTISNRGAIFDPSQDLLYAVDGSTNFIKVYNTTTWALKTQFALGDTVTSTGPFGTGVMSISAGGQYLFLHTDSGIRVYNVGAASNMTVPSDSDLAIANAVTEGAPNGTYTGLTAASTPAVPNPTYSLTNNAGGRFAIDANTGMVTVANASLINFESATSHTVTVQAANSVGGQVSANFTIQVNNVNPTNPADANSTLNFVAPGSANGSLVGITASSTDPNGAPLTYALTDNAGGRFAINASTGVVSVANASVLNGSVTPSHNITVQASDGSGGVASSVFSIEIGFPLGGGRPVGGQMWHDLNANGIQDAWEPGVPGAVAELFNAVDGVIGNGNDISLGVQITDASGSYQFSLQSFIGPNYYIVYRTPVGFSFTTFGVGANGTINSDANQTTGVSRLFSLVEGDMNWDAGLTGGAPAFGFALSIAPTGNASARSVKLDTAGNAYILGDFDGNADFDPGPGVFNMNGGLTGKSFVAKYTSMGALIWARAFGNSGSAQDITLDAAGNVYATGNFASTADFDPGNGTFLLSSVSGTYDVYVCKLDPAGNFVWAKAMGGNQSDYGFGIALDSQNNVYTTGYYSANADFNPGNGTFNLITPTGFAKAFVSKLDSDGNFVWAKRFSGTGESYGNEIAIDAADNVYTTGYFYVDIDLDPGTAISSVASLGNNDAYVSKLDSSGNFVWGRQIGAAGFDVGYSIAVDSSQNVFVGASWSGNNAFVTKLASNANTTWSKTFGAGSARALSVFLDNSGDVFSAGSFTSTSDFNADAGTFTLTNAGATDGYYSRLSGSGAFATAGRIGGTGSDTAFDLVRNAAGDTFLTGTFESAVDFDPSAARVFSLTANAAYSGAFLYKLADANQAPGVIQDVDLAANRVFDHAAAGTAVGLTALALDPDFNQVTYSLTDNAGGRFAIDPTTGVVSVANGTLLDSSVATSHNITVSAVDSAFLPQNQTFTIEVVPNSPGAVNDLNNANNSILEGSANGTSVGITAFAAYPGNVTYSLSNSAGGRFAIDPSSGVVTVLSGNLLNYETTTTHNITVVASAGNGSTSADFAIAVLNANPSVPVDIDAANNTITEGAAQGNLVGLTVRSTDPAGGTIFYSLIDDAGGRFTMSSSGVFTVAAASLIDYETAQSHQVTVQASDGRGGVSQATFTITVANFSPTTPVDTDPATNSVYLGAVNGTTVGVTAFSTDPNSNVTFWLPQNAGGAFAIDPVTGVITVADNSRLAIGNDLLAVAATDGAGVTKVGNITIHTFDPAAMPFQFDWVRTGGDTNADEGRDVAADSQGNVYVTGIFFGNMTLGATTLTTTSIGDPDAFVAKFAPNGTLLWAANFAGASYSKGNTLAIDSAGDILVAGYFNGDCDMDPGPAIVAATSLGSNDAFLTKLDSSGHFLWFKQIGGASVQQISDIAIDPANGDIVATGQYANLTDFDPGPGNTTLGSSFSSQDIFALRLNAAGDFLWVKTVSVTPGATDEGQSIGVDSGGNVYVSGFFTGTGDFDPGPGFANMTTSALSGDSFLWKLDRDGNYVWAKRWGGDQSIDYAYALGVDANDNVFVGGQFRSTSDFDPGPGTMNITSAGGEDAFLSKFDSAGNLVWAKTFGGVNADRIHALTIDAAGNVYASGIVANSIDFDPGPGDYRLGNSGFDAFVSKFDKDGTFQWAANFGGLQSDFSYGVAWNGNAIYTTGYFNSTADLDPTPAVATEVGNGNTAFYLSKLSLGVLSINHAPSFTAGPNQTILEDTGGQTVPTWASSISPGGTDETNQSLTFQIVGNTNPSLFAVAPAISPNGTLTYTPAANANGVALVTVQLFDDGGIANGGVNASANQTFAISVTPVNDAPTFTRGANQSVLEDAVAQTIPWATSISAGPADEAGQALDFRIVGNTNPSLFSVTPAVSANGTLTYTPAANANGIATLTVLLSDSGGTANGGANTSLTQTFTITVTPVNDAPSFTRGANQSLLEDAGTQSVSGWATAIAAGPADEAAQNLTFRITSNSNAALFSSAPSISPNGTLTYTPAPNANGVAFITLVLQDDGGIANSGANTSLAQTFSINVDAVNDAPAFTPGVNVTVSEDSGTVTIPGWASALSAGPNESTQTIAFQVTGNTNPSLFSVAPAVSSNGTLTFTPAANASGSANLTLLLQDSGGTANGGLNATIPVTFVVNVLSVNDPPVVTAATGALAYTENDGVRILDGGFSVSDIDSAILTGATLSFTSNYSLGQDVLSFADQNGITGDFNATLGTLTLSGSASVASYQDALRSIAYTNNSEEPSSTNRKLTLVVNDGVASSVAVTRTITISAVNDAPIISPSVSNVTYQQGSNLTIDPGVVVSDIDSPNLSGANIAITSNFVAGQDSLGFTNQNGIAGSFNATTGVLTLSGASSAANYQTALRSVVYANANATPSLATRTVSVQVNDGASSSNLSNVAAISVRINAAPRLSPIANQTISIANSDVAFSASDPNGDPLTYDATYQSVGYYLRNTYGLTINAPKNNYGGQQEKWFIGSGGVQFFLMPDGRFYHWDGTVNAAVGSLLITISPAYYANPNLITTESRNGYNLTLSILNGNAIHFANLTSYPAQLVVTAAVSDGTLSDSKSFLATVINAPPVLDAIPNKFIPLTTDFITVDLHAVDPENDPISYSVSVSSQAQVLNQQLALAGTALAPTFLTNYNNRIGEKWVYARDPNKLATQPASDYIWYYILPNGDLFRWDKTPYISKGTFISNVGSYVYKAPTLLLNSTAGNVNVAIVGNQIKIDPPAGYLGTFTITAKATDIVGNFDTKSFNVTVGGGRPTLQQPADQTIARGQSITIPLVASDPNGLPLTYRVSSEAMMIKGQYGLGYTTQKYTSGVVQPTLARWMVGAGSGIYFYILPDGRLYRYDQRATDVNSASTLMQTIDPRYYQSTYLLTDANYHPNFAARTGASTTVAAAPLPGVTAPWPAATYTLLNGNLVITPAASFAAIIAALGQPQKFVLTIQVDNGIFVESKSFTLTVT